MAVFNEPTQWDHELGNHADVSTLPDDTSATTGVASLQKLFQLINQTPLEAGGVAPEREDFNALFKILGDSVFYGMNGGLASYNPAYDYVVGRYVVYNNTLYKCIQANGASSTVVAPDSVSPLGSDYWVQVATLADIANFANIDLSNLSATGQALFTNKADKDFTNIDNTAKIAIAHNSMPSDVYDDLTLGASGSTYTAPADGYVVIWAGLNPDNGITIGSNTNGMVSAGRVGSPGGITGCNLPVKKGENFTVDYGGINVLYRFRFVYAVGSESEQ